MANTKKYLSHLLQNTGITPACSEEERAAADVIAKIFTDHGFTPEVQEFTASATPKIVQAALGVLVFVGAVLMGIGGAVGIVGLLLVVAAAALFVAERTGHPVLSKLGSGGLSQNVIAYHKASGPLASPRNRPVVVVAHYDSPREDLLTREPFAQYRPLIAKLLPFAMVAPAVIAVVRLLPIPDVAKVVLWLLAVVAAAVPLLNAVAIIANRFVLPYTTGSVCNKSSVAAMLGVMDAVSPYELGEEFPHDTPADEYFAEQQRILEEAIAAAQAAAEAAAMAETAYPHELDENGEPLAAEGDAAEDADGTEVDGFPAEAAEEPVGATLTDMDFTAGDPGSTMAMGAALGFPEIDDPALTVDEVAEVEFEDADGGMDEVGATAVNLPVLNDEAPAYEPDVPVEESGDPAEESASEPEPDCPFRINAAGNVRFGAEAIAALGMLPASCHVVYEDEQPEVGARSVSPRVVEQDAPVEEPGFYEHQVFDEGVEADVTEDVAPEDELELEYEPEVAGEPELEFDPELAEEPESGSEFECEPELDTVIEAEYEVISESEFSEEPTEGVQADQVAEEAPRADGELPLEVEPQVELGLAGEEESTGDEVQAQVQAEPDQAGDTQVFDVSDATSTVAMPMLPVQDTVDSLMSQITQRPQRSISVPSTADTPTPRTPASANRASLFDLPDPSAASDPFASASEVQPPRPTAEEDAQAARSAFTVISSVPEPEQEKPRRGLARFFGRKKKRSDGDIDTGRNPGFDSWDDLDDDDGWKGGAAGYDGVSEDELREAVANMGDDELLGHDIWFVATGASENDNAGIRAFLETHRDKLRGVFLINLESVGAGDLAMVATEGAERVLKGDKRIMKLVRRVSSDYHHEFATVDLPHVTTDAHVAMGMSLRSLTIGGVDGSGFALSHTEADQPYNLDVDNAVIVSDVVTEVIRRS